MVELAKKEHLRGGENFNLFKLQCLKLVPGLFVIGSLLGLGIGALLVFCFRANGVILSYFFALLPAVLLGALYLVLAIRDIPHQIEHKRMHEYDLGFLEGIGAYRYFHSRNKWVGESLDLGDLSITPSGDGEKPSANEVKIWTRFLSCYERVLQDAVQEILQEKNQPKGITCSHIKPYALVFKAEGGIELQFDIALDGLAPDDQFSVVALSENFEASKIVNL